MQGSAIGPASYVVNATGLTTVTAGKLIFTALHEMQTRYSDENFVRLSVYLSVCLSVCPSVRLSVCHMREL